MSPGDGFVHSAAEAGGQNPFENEFVQIGNYEIVGRINSGGMGSVYEAWQAQPRRVVALKLLHTTLAAPVQLTRFKQEAEALGRLQHPNIAQIYEAGSHTRGDLTIPFLAMERVPGARSINEFVRTQKIGWQEILRLFVKVVSAIEHAHHRKILHRDLKPSNILVNEHGEPKVIDFGVAKFVDHERGATLTNPNLLVGTLQYMSPEQAQQQPVDERSDQYALGVVLYELLCGTAPYSVVPGQVLQTARAIIESPPQSPLKYNAVLPMDLVVVLLKTLEKKPQDRYANLGEWTADLVRVLNGESVHARALPPWLVGARWVRKHATHHPIVTAMVLAVIAILISYPYLAWIDRSGFLRFVETTMIAHLNHFPDIPLKDVRIIAITPDTIRHALPDEAVRATENPAFERPALRKIYGLVTEQLAAAGPRSVTFDISFPAAASQDAAMQQSLADANAMMERGFAALKRNDIPCIIVNPEFVGRPADAPWVEPLLKPLVTGGCDFGAANEKSPWMVFLATQRNGRLPKISLALATYLAINRLAIDPEFFVLDERELLVANVPIKTTVNLPLGPGFEKVGVEADDMAGQFYLEMPHNDSLETITLPLEELINATPNRLKELVQGRCIVIGDTRPGRDQHKTSDGRIFHGVHAHALSIQLLLDKKAIQRLGFFYLGPILWHSELYLFVGGALIGGLIGWRLSYSRVLLAMLIAVAGTVGVLIGLYQFGGWLFSPTTFLLPLLVAALISTLFKLIVNQLTL